MTTDTEGDRAQFEDRGYHLHREPLVDPALIERARDRIPAIIAEHYDTGIPPWRRLSVGEPHKLQKIDQVHLCDRAFHQLVTHPAIGALVARLTGAELVQVWATQLFIKPPGGGELNVVGWHTDRANWPFWDGEVLTVWLALEDIGPDAGPVIYVEGSHRWPDGEKRGDAYEQDLARLEDRIQALGPPRPWRKVPNLVKAGGVGVHVADILHASGANASTSSRLGLAINVRTERARPKPGVEDYGYASYLDQPFIAPILYRRPPPPLPAVLARLAPHLRAGMRVLDAGSWDGEITAALVQFVLSGSGTATGVDIARWEDGHALPFEDGAFDAVLCHRWFFALAQPAAAIQDLFRVCKPGASIGVCELLGLFEGLPPVTVNGVERSVSDLVRTIFRAAGGEANIATRLKGLLADAGFVRITCTTRSDLHSEPAQLARLQAQVQAMLAGEATARAIRAGAIDPATVAAIVERTRGWLADPSAIGVTSWIEYVAWKP
jgi:SAM-dependent methyltransferase